jgi:hypothetical protein
MLEIRFVEPGRLRAALQLTDLADREIVLGKFLSRLAHMTMLLLMGLPVVSLLPESAAIMANHTLRE